MNWDSILHESTGTYYPNSEFVDKKDCSFHGTTITLSNLSRVTNFDLNATAISLSKLFNWFDTDFSITISHNGSESLKLTRELRYIGII